MKNTILVLLILFFTSLHLRIGALTPRMIELGYEYSFWNLTKIITVILVAVFICYILKFKFFPDKQFIYFVILLVIGKVISSLFASTFSGTNLNISSLLNYSQAFIVPIIISAFLKDISVQKKFSSGLLIIHTNSIIIGWYNFLNRIQIQGLSLNIMDFPRMGVGAEYGYFGSSDYSICLLMLLPFLLFKYISINRNIIEKKFLLCSIILNVLSQLLTFHRTGFIFTILIFIIVYLNGSNLKIAFTHGLKLLSLLIVITSIGVIINDNLWDLFSQRFLSILNIFTLDPHNVDDYAVYGRLLAQINAIQIFLSHPFWGIGHGNLLTPDFGLFGGFQSAENMYLMTLAESGIIFFVLFSIVIICLFQIKNNRILFQSSKIALFIALMLALGSTIENNQWFLLHWGVLFSFNKIGQNENRQLKPNQS